MNAQATTLAVPHRSRFWTSIALVALLIASAFSAVINASPASAQDSGHAIADAVPAGTVLYFEANLDQTSDQWVQTFDLIDRAGLNDVAESESGQSTDEIADTAESMNATGQAAMVFTDVDALVDFSTAETSAASSAVTTELSDATTTSADAMASLESGDVPAVPEGFALLVQPTDAQALADQFVDMTNDEAETAGATVQTVDYNGTTITYYESSDPATPGTATAMLDGTVILATRVSDIEPILDTIAGNNDSLALEAGFGAVADKLGSENLFFGYMNLDLMVTAIQNSPEFDQMYGSAADLEQVEAAKGQAGFSVYASEDGFHADSVMIPNDAAQLTAGDSFTPSMASAFPADVMIFGNSNNLYGTGISDAIAEILAIALASSGDTTATPAATPSAEETWALLETYFGFNPDTDLLQKLDGEYAAYAGLYDIDSMTPTPKFLFVSDTSDAETLSQTMVTVTSLLENMNSDEAYTVSSRTVNGAELTVITFDSSETSGLPMVIEFGVVNDQMLIGANGAIDDYLAGTSAPLADDANYQAVMAALPTDNVTSLTYVNIEGQIMPILDLVVSQLSASMSTLDNAEECGDYATQQEAQAAYDADPINLWILDLDYDGTACEDFFAPSAPEATPESISSQVNIPAAGSVTWTDEDAVWTSSVLLIGD